MSAATVGSTPRPATAAEPYLAEAHKPTVEQQPVWSDIPLARHATDRLASASPIVTPEEIRSLRTLLISVAAGRAQVLQAGDCAEAPTDNSPETLRHKTDQLHAVASVMESGSGLAVTRVGRIAGQFAKPRSKPMESVGTVQLPVFRGPMVNRSEPWPLARDHDALGLLVAYQWAARGAAWLARNSFDVNGSRVWTSHEALVLDYERPQVVDCESGERFLTSTHWPWIGERTRDPDGAHVQLMAAVDNPVGVKLGPGASVSDVLRLCEVLDPARTPGRLTFIGRFGAERVRDQLRALVPAVAAEGFPVIWMCDPMHANTQVNLAGLKVRSMTDIVHEMVEFISVLGELDVSAGGIHLEATPDSVAECADAWCDIDGVTEHGYRSLCDPRLNGAQTLYLASKWALAHRSSVGVGAGIG